MKFNPPLLRRGGVASSRRRGSPYRALPGTERIEINPHRHRSGDTSPSSRGRIAQVSSRRRGSRSSPSLKGRCRVFATEGKSILPFFEGEVSRLRDGGEVLTETFPARSRPRTTPTVTEAVTPPPLRGGGSRRCLHDIGELNPPLLRRGGVASSRRRGSPYRALPGTATREQPPPSPKR